MCDPLTIAGAALSVGSTVANASAARKAESARNDALAAERIRQSGLDREAQTLNTKSQDRYENFDEKTETKAKALGDYFAPPTEPTEVNAAAALPEGANNIVVREMAKKSGEAREFTDQQGNALAQLRAFGDVLADTSRLQARDASLVGQIGSFKRGSTNVLPLELDEAANAGKKAGFLGDLLGGLGGIALNAGLTGGKLFGGGAVGAKPAVAAAPVARAAAAPATLYPQQRFGGVY